MAIPTPKTPSQREPISNKKPENARQETTKRNIEKPSVVATSVPNRTFHKASTPKSSGGDFLSTIVSVLIIILIGVGMYMNKEMIIDKLNDLGLRGDESVIVDENGLFPGKEVDMTGTIMAETTTDYTHILSTNMNVGLRSRQDMSQYVGQEVEFK